MDFETYSSFWNSQASTPEGALAAVDGSASEEIVQLTGRWTARQVAAALDLDGDSRVLELGCGVGRIGRELADTVGHWHGVDISAQMIDAAARRLEGLQQVQLTQLHNTSLSAIDDASLNRAYSVAVLCHIDKEDLFLYLREIARVLEEGGLAYLETWNLDHPMGWKRWMFEVNNWARSDQSLRKNVARNQFCTPDEFCLYAREAGLDLLRCYSESPWIQWVGGRDLSAEDLSRHGARLDECEHLIVHTEQWGKLFGDLLDVIYGVTPPARMLAQLDAANGEDPEIDLYRRYLLALWKQGEAHWGAVPTTA